MSIDAKIYNNSDKNGKPPNIYIATHYTYRLFNGDIPSFLGKTLVFVWIANILLSIVTSMMETLPLFRYKPLSCSSPVCSNVPTLCPDSMTCAPVPLEVFDTIDDVCVYLFTIEYCVRLLTSWTDNSQQSDDDEEEENKENSYVSIGNNSGPNFRPFMNTFRFVFRFFNVVDLVCILPYWIGTFAGSSSQGAGFLRVLRVMRIFKMFRFSRKPQQFMELILATLHRSMPALGVLVTILSMSAVFFAFIIYFVEGGTFRVTDDYPGGVYLRRNMNGLGWEISPFSSVPTSIYWVITTSTTVGYGDMYPTSWIGRSISCILMISGVLVLALPIGVIGTNFSHLYVERLDLDWKTASNLIDVDSLDDADIVTLFHQFEHSSNGAITRRNFRTAFAAAGVEASDEFFETLFAKADEDGTGELTEEKFVAMCRKMRAASVGLSLKKKKKSPYSSFSSLEFEEKRRELKGSFFRPLPHMQNFNRPSFTLGHNYSHRSSASTSGKYEEKSSSSIRSIRILAARDLDDTIDEDQSYRPQGRHLPESFAQRRELEGGPMHSQGDAKIQHFTHSQALFHRSHNPTVVESDSKFDGSSELDVSINGALQRLATSSDESLLSNAPLATSAVTAACAAAAAVGATTVSAIETSLPAISAATTAARSATPAGSRSCITSLSADPGSARHQLLRMRARMNEELDAMKARMDAEIDTILAGIENL